MEGVRKRHQPPLLAYSQPQERGGGITLYNGLRLKLRKRVRISQVEVYRRFHGRGRHLGSGANAAKFTVNV